MRMLAALVLLLPLACWPALGEPFSIPKLWIIASLALIAATQAIRQRPRLPDWPWLLWAAAISLSALAGPFVSFEAFLLMLLPAALCALDFDPIPAIRAGSAIESAFAVLQWCGCDPFFWFGWRPEAFAGPRMRVYGTLGNPDFVAAWLCATLPLWAGARGAIRAGGILLQAAALLATGSRLPLLALPVAGIVYVLRHRVQPLRCTRRSVSSSRQAPKPSRDREGAVVPATGLSMWRALQRGRPGAVISIRNLMAAGPTGQNAGSQPKTASSYGRIFRGAVGEKRGTGVFACRMALAALPLLCAVLWLSPARPLDETIRGRLYLVRVTAAHLLEVPPAGFGPGAFRIKFSQWQPGWLAAHKRDAPFAGPVDHAHNDYLEFLVEYGPLGFGAILLLCGWLGARAWRSGAPSGILASLAALAAAAVVDFPFHRPAEWTLFWILTGLAIRKRRMPSCPHSSA